MLQQYAQVGIKLAADRIKVRESTAVTELLRPGTHGPAPSHAAPVQRRRHTHQEPQQTPPEPAARLGTALASVRPPSSS